MLEDMMTIISFHIVADDGDENLVSEEFIIHVVPQFTRFQLKFTILANGSEVIPCNVIVMSTSDNVIVVEFGAARVTIRRVVELVLLVCGQFHGFLFVENFVDFLQFRTHVPVKMLHRIGSAVNVRDFFVVLGVFVFRYVEATNKDRCD